MSIYDTLNDEQQRAVFQTDGPVLILAGAGSGKTRVLTHRIAYLINEKGINPWNIMAITFTNKASGEMRERVDNIVGFGSESIWVSTFHSSCVRILRRYIDRIGYDNHFTIYDTDDQKTIMREICKRLQIDTKKIKERAFLGAISSAKNELISPIEYELNTMGDYGKKKQSEVYKEYQRVLLKNNALDFDDLLVKAVELFKSCPDVLEQYQDRFKYIMVDEYQDTNTAQFEFIRLLAAKNRNLCVVGDDDQSIYKFRGANIRNIIDFEMIYPEATVIKLEQNYRSTQNILNAANSVIQNNRQRKDKKLWTQSEEGNRVHFRQFDNAYEEAEYIGDDICKKVKNHQAEYGQCAVLYRTNAQSRLLEERLVMEGVPYNVVGGTNFYSRKEIKDILAYLKTIDNGKDDVAVRRIINTPKRGLGATTLDRVGEYAAERGISFFDALEEAEQIMAIGKSYLKIKPFVLMILGFRAKLNVYSLEDLIRDLLETTGYYKEFEESDEEEAKDRIANIDELISKVVSYEEVHDEPTLSEFLEEVALVADIDRVGESDNRILLMTVHSSKGLEFEHVYLSGMEDGIFPSYMTISSDDPTEIEEERRLAYVAITRAKKELTISSAKQRMMRGETQYNPVSRFVREIPHYLMDNKPQEQKHRYDDYEPDSYTKTYMKSNPFSIGGSSSIKDIYGVQSKTPYEGNIFSGKRAGASLSNDVFDLKKPTSSKGTDYRLHETYGVGNARPTAKVAGKVANTFSKGLDGLAELGVHKGVLTTSNELQYEVGDRVKHLKYGVGTVEKIEQAPKDYQVTVLFDVAGVKVMYAAYAKLQKV